MRYVLIADDHEVTRRGLRELLWERFPSLEVVETFDVPSTLAALDTHPWELILLDILMPGGHIIDLLKQVRDRNTNVPILILTAAEEPEYVVQTLKAGANGLVHKHRAAAELLDAIDIVSNGGRYLDRDGALAVAEFSASLEGELEAHHRLSPRELDIFRRIAQGQAVKEIAADLNLSDKTVATYLARIRSKTKLSSHVEIARYALAHKLVD